MQNPPGQTTTVWKWTVEVKPDPTIIRMPAGARVVHVAAHPLDASAVDFWAEVHVPTPILESRAFVVIPTGGAIPYESFEYVGTAPHRIGLVWHLYEVVVPVTTEDLLETGR